MALLAFLNVAFSDTESCERLVAALAHFLWQGAALALVAWLAALALRRASAQARYATHLAALLLMTFASGEWQQCPPNGKIRLKSVEDDAAGRPVAGAFDVEGDGTAGKRFKVKGRRLRIGEGLDAGPLHITLSALRYRRSSRTCEAKLTIAADPSRVPNAPPRRQTATFEAGK